MSNRPLRLGLVALLACVPVAAVPATGPDWRAAEPGHAWSFPADHLAHPDYRTEWWYLTGLLDGEDGRRYGYQFTLFRVGLTRTPAGAGSSWRAGQLVMGHAAVTEIDGAHHRFSETLHRTAPMLAGVSSALSPTDPTLAWVRAPAGTDSRWSIGWNGSGFDLAMRDDARRVAFRLRTTATRGPLLHGEDGFSRKSADGSSASQYYSFTRLGTSGTLELDGTSVAVRGTSWMDKEFSTSHLADEQVGWDWFSLRLADGRDLMLYRLRRADGTTSYASATLVEPDGRVLTPAPDAWRVEPLERWTTADGEVRYPVAWRLTLPAEGIDATVRAYVRAAENVSRTAAGLRYWEGPVQVVDADGAPLGEGFVELTGYGRNTRPPV